jgi:DNA-binding beta-propeller fold protein YncE
MGRRTRRLRCMTIAGTLVVLALPSAGPMVTQASAAHVSHDVAASGHLALNHPVAIAAGAGHLWVANLTGNSVTELTYRGAVVRTLSAPKFGFRSPDAVTVSGAHVFVLNRHGSVTELSAVSGSLVRIIRGARYEFRRPTALIAHGGDVWVVDTGSSAVTEFSASGGSLVRVLDPLGNHRFGLRSPVALAAAGPDIWVLNPSRVAGGNAGSLTEIVAATGALKRVVHGSALGLLGSRGIAFDGRHLWVSDSTTSSVSELTATGAFKAIINNSSTKANYGFNAPTAVTAYGHHVYVISPPGSSPMVTQIETSTALGNWYECNTNSPDPNFANPTGLAVQGHHVWVVSPANNSLAELSTATGLLIKEFS